MLKGILFCLLCLAALLLLLAYIDYRTRHSRSQATYSAKNLPLPLRQHDATDSGDDAVLPPPG